MMDKHQTSVPENQRIYKFIQSYFLLQWNILSRFKKPWCRLLENDIQFLGSADR